MSRYIDADKAIEYLEEHKRYSLENNEILCADENAIIRFINDKCPTADVAEVVRCKDCKNYVHFDGADRDMCKRNAVYDDYNKAYYGLCAVEKTHFCSYGERK